VENKKMIKNEQLHMRMDKEFRLMLFQRADQKGLNVSDYLRDLVNEDVKTGESEELAELL
jgi:hypothetical protein